MSKDPETILLQALVSTVGIEVKTTDPRKLRAKLYRIRADNADYANLTIRIPSTESNVLWVGHEAKFKKGDSDDGKA